MQPYAWSWDPDALVVVPGMAIAYSMALSRFPASRLRVASFAAGCAMLLLVQVSPVSTIALHYLLTAHLLQNVVLAEWAPLLCVLGLSPAAALALERLPGVRTLTHPLVALPLWLGTYFAWHVPWLYNAALRHQWSVLHLEHASYFAAGCLVWWPVIHGRYGSGTKALYLFGAWVLGSPLGLLLALLPSAVYSFYKQGPGLWGLSPLTDQQIAGVTMAGEQAVVFFAAFAVYLLRFLHEEDAADAFRAPTSSSRGSS